MSLTIGSSANLNELIASMLAQMSGTPSTSTPPAAPTSTAPVSPARSTTNNAVIGNGKASYSNEIMRLFTQMHQSVGGASSGSSASSSSATTTTIASATTLATPIDSILSSIDTGDDATTASAIDPDASDASDTAPWSAHVRALRPDE